MERGQRANSGPSEKRLQICVFAIDLIGFGGWTRHTAQGSSEHSDGVDRGHYLPQSIHSGYRGH